VGSQDEAAKAEEAACKAKAAELEGMRKAAEDAKRAAVAEAEQRLQGKLQELADAQEAARVRGSGAY